MHGFARFYSLFLFFQFLFGWQCENFVHLTRSAPPRSVYGAAKGVLPVCGCKKLLAIQFVGLEEELRGAWPGGISEPFGAVIKHANCIRANCQVNGTLPFELKYLPFKLNLSCELRTASCELRAGGICELRKKSIKCL